MALRVDDMDIDGMVKTQIDRAIPVLKKTYPFFLLTVNLILAILSFYCFAVSPYTGIRTELLDKHPIAKTVDTDSPADRAGVKTGDLILDINDSSIPFQAFSMDPDFLSSKKDQHVFWVGRDKLNHTLREGRPALIQVRRAGRLMNVSLTPLDFPFTRTFGRLWYFYVCGFCYLSITFLVYRKKKDEISAALFLFGSSFCMVLLTGANDMRDLSHPVFLHKALMLANHVGTYLSAFSFAHLAFVFPRRRPILARHPWIVPGIYGVMAAGLALEITPFIDNSYLTINYPVSIAAIASGIKLIVDYVREKDLVLRKQIQWVVTGFMFFALWGGVYVIIWASDSTGANEALEVLPMIVVPVCWAVAVTKYRLMDIDDIFDHAVIFAITIVVLEAIELLVLGAVSPHVPFMQRTPYLSLTAVLLIVFLYIPVRTRVRTAVEKLFKRGGYRIDEELQKFIVGLGGCDTLSALERFSSFVQGLLGPSGIGIIQFRKGGAAVVHTRGAGARSAADFAAAQAEGLRTCFPVEREAAFGYELAGKGVPAGPWPGPDLEGSLFIPFFIGDACAYLAVLLPKWNRTSYTRTDRRLLNAVSASMAHTLEAEEKRRALEEERLRLAREIHDGISSEFTGILAYGEKGSSALDRAASNPASKDLFDRIVTSSRRGMQELRNVIWALNTERQSCSHLAAYAKRFASDFLDVGGITVTMRDHDDRDETLLPPSISLTIFRIVQELCHNTLKHANASRVTMGLGQRDGMISLVFEDNGRGYNPEGAISGNGLRNIRKRVDEIRGTIHVAAAPGKGTAVSVRLPIP